MKTNLFRRAAFAAAALLCIAIAACTSEAEYLKMKQDPDLVDAVKYLKKEKYEKARKKLEEALKTEPKNPYARYRLALFDAETNTDASIKTIKDAISDIPSSDSSGLTEAYKALASIHSTITNDWSQAAKAYAKAYDFSHDPEILREHAFCLANDGQFEEALPLFDISEGTTPSVARASCKLKLGKIKEAAEEAVAAFDSPSNMDAVLLIYEISAKDGTAVENALLDAANKNSDNYWPLVILGDIKKSNDNFAEAIDTYTKALSKAKKTSDIYESIAECHYNIGELGKALDNINKAIDNADSRDERNRLKEKRAEMTLKGE